MKFIPLLLFFVGTVGFSQTVVVDHTSNTPAQLVDILMGNGCVNVSNVSSSSNQSVAYFNNQGGAFPISEGVIVRSGKAKFSEGSYTDTNLSSQVNSNSDPYLGQIFANSGQNPVITDVAFLEFEFTPLSSEFSFDFLFASNEYGAWQCSSSDVFAFLLTDIATGTTTNLAVVPGTTTPISIRSIKDKAYNPTCSSDNPNLFSTYQVGTPATSTINMRGYTVVMNAHSGITSGNTYRIRLVIGDSNDSDFDSALFLSAGSFNANINLGADRSICTGDLQTLGTGLDSAVYQHTWSRNGTVIPGETGNTLLVSQSGTYQVSIAQNSSSCLLTDEVIFSELMVQNPTNLTACYDASGNYSYDLTLNDEAALGINNAIYDLTYYASMADIAAQNPIPSSNLNNYASPGNQSIYIKILNTTTGEYCNAVYSFNLRVNSQIVLTQPTPIEVCAEPGSSPSVDLTQKKAEILNGQNASNFAFSYFSTLSDAQNNSGAITDPANFSVPAGTSSYTVWVRVEDAQMPNCFNTISLDILLNQPPPVETSPDIVECSSYTLPNLTYSEYYTAPNGGGQQLFPGDVITTSGIYYIFNGPDSNGCTKQSNFEVILADEYEITDTTHCGEFIIPSPDVGIFYSAPGGPNGSGTILASGTTINTSQTIYYYVEINDVFCRDEAIAITIFPLPPVDHPSNIVTCDQYVLPPLTNGTYFTGSNGNGTQKNPGDVITSSQYIYVFNDDGRCINQHRFHVTIIQLSDFTDVDVCGSYTLPEVEVGGYYTQASGGGQQIPAGTQITTTQTIYYYAVTTSTPNCTENLAFEVVNTPIPPVDDLPDILRCEDDPYILPSLTHGNYFTETGRNGIELFPSDTITETQTIYINNLVNGCDNETSFEVEIRPLPPIAEFTNVYSCDPYELPTLTNGNFYTEAGGNGTLLPGGELITTTQTIYIYNEYDDLTTCFSENSFTVYINGVTGDFTFDDVTTCDEYILPPLETGNYFTESNEGGTPLFAGDTLITSQEIYVYVENGDRFVCTAEESFFVEIAQTPILLPFDNIERCGSYTLPELPETDYQVGYYRSPNGEDVILPSEYLFSEPGTYTIYVYATSETNSACYDEAQFQLTIYPLLELNIEGGTLCRNAETGAFESSLLLVSGLDPTEFEVNWYLDENLVHTGANYDATAPGTYTVKTDKLLPEIGANCNYKPTTVRVFESAKPIVEVKVTQPFSEIAVATVNVLHGYDDYEYQLDQGSFQGTNEFYDVESGSHTITVRGIHGDCGETTVTFEVIKFPKSFTPNGDGVYDRWNIKDLWEHPEARITIFDRYGKLVATFPPRSEGWDGQYNGKPMPSSEYWFVVEFEQKGAKKVFKSHFSLIR